MQNQQKQKGSAVTEDTTGSEGDWLSAVASPEQG